MPPRRVRAFAFVAAVLVAAVATLFGAPSPAVAVPAVPTYAPNDECTTDQWRNPANFQSCVDKLKVDISGRLRINEYLWIQRGIRSRDRK